MRTLNTALSLIGRSLAAGLALISMRRGPSRAAQLPAATRAQEVVSSRRVPPTRTSWGRRSRGIPAGENRKAWQAVNLKPAW